MLVSVGVKKDRRPRSIERLGGVTRPLSPRGKRESKIEKGGKENLNGWGSDGERGKG